MTRRPVVVTSYQPHWVEEFARIAKHIRDLVGPAAIRIDHIGSTAVPGLGAKDVIDLQITVSDLDAADGLTHALRTAGFRHGITLEYDLFHRKSETDPELRKLYMREPEGERRAHIHIRPDSIDGYLFLKDPVLHIIYEAASLWAEKVGWSPDEDYV